MQTQSTEHLRRVARQKVQANTRSVQHNAEHGKDLCRVVNGAIVHYQDIAASQHASSQEVHHGLQVVHPAVGACEGQVSQRKRSTVRTTHTRDGLSDDEAVGPSEICQARNAPRAGWFRLCYDVQRLPSHRPASLDSLAFVKPTLTTNSSERTENGRNHLVKELQHQPVKRLHADQVFARVESIGKRELEHVAVLCVLG